MFFSNLDNPLVITGGTYPDGALAIKNALVGAADSPWLEVTGAAPTPAFLQPLASTVTAAGDSTAGYDRHVTLYLKDDPGLTATTPHARLFRMVMFRYGVMTMFIDTKFGNPTDYNQWTLCSRSNNIEWSELYSDAGASFGSLFNTKTAETANVGGAGRNLTIRILMWEDFLYIKVIRGSDGNELGGIMLFYPNTIPGDQQTTETIPMIWAMPSGHSQDLQPWNNNNLTQLYSARVSDLIVPTYSSNAVFGNRFEGYVQELGFIPGYGDKDDREYLQRIALVANAPAVTHWGGLNPHIRVTRNAAAQGLFDRKVIDGVEYMEIKNYQGIAWYLRLADNNAL